MRNGEVFLKDPLELRILNNGVAKVSEDETEDELRTLRYELETFVCGGSYARGLERILDSFITAVDQPDQKGVWVSGFFGSGKSHLVKMLKALWVDTEFPDGATARGLVDIPSDISDHLKELSTAGKRLGGLHAASGTLGAGANNVRLALLGIVFKSAGLPEEYPQARFVMRLIEEGHLEDVRAHVEAAGKSWESELRNMYVSKDLHEALVKKAPGFADSVKEARSLLKEQFPYIQDVTTDQMIEAIRDALTKEGKFPLTLIVLDEVQQYIGEDAALVYDVQEATEACCKMFGGRLLFVATGQTALSGTPMLQKLMRRFQVSVELSDTDIDEVVRKVILAKKPDAISTLNALADENVGEISRHIQGSQIAHRSEDLKVFAADYPLLPVRRRLWENILRTVDQSGTSRQLANQLKLVHEATRENAEKGVGNVVPADFIYDQLSSQMLQSGVLSRQIHKRISELKVGTEEDVLKGRLCSMVFLLSKLPQDSASDLGIRATTESLADLMLEDLKKGSTSLRKKIPDLLEQLEAEGIIMRVDDEYRLQTREGNDWNEEYRKQMSKLSGDPNRLAAERGDLFRQEAKGRLQGIRITQGESMVLRKHYEHFGPEEPEDMETEINVWVRDGWETDEKTVRREATAAGNKSPTIFVFLPRAQADELNHNLASLKAADATINVRGTPHTTEGNEARNAMTTRRDQADRKLTGIIDDLFADAIVILGGGKEISGATLGSKVEEAAEAAIIRLYPKFNIADQSGWEKVIRQTRKGDLAALEAVEHTGEASEHAVCQAIIGFIGSGKKGSDIRDHFESGLNGFGWPRDAIDGALYILLAAGYIQATDTDRKSVDAKVLERPQISKTNFKVEAVVPPAGDKLKVRKILQELGLPAKAGDEQSSSSNVLSSLWQFADAAGGEPPRPKQPSLSEFDELNTMMGNELIVALAEAKDAILSKIDELKNRSSLIVKRMPRWEALQSLLIHLVSLEGGEEIIKQTDAIVDNRLLLNEPDLVPELCDGATRLLREEIKSNKTEYKKVYDKETKYLGVDSSWKKLKDKQKQEILLKHGIYELPDVKTGSESELLSTLSRMPLSIWRIQREAIPERFRAAREEAARILEPKAARVNIPSRTIKNEREMEQWLSEARTSIEKGLKKGPVIL